MSRIIVVGGGPAGMMAACAAAGKNHEVLLLEKNEKLGKKLFITGKGRCNLTNACSPEVFFSSLVTNPKFLYSSFSQFTNQDVMDFFVRHGCPLKIERGNRVFPTSDKSSDVIRAMERALSQASVQVQLNTEVVELLFKNAADTEKCKDAEKTKDAEATKKSSDAERIKTAKEKICIGVKVKSQGRIREEKADAVIIATGGCSYPSTGSTGDGWRFAQAAGHQIKTPVPALVPLLLEEEDAKELQGLSLKNIEIRVIQGKKEKFREFGEMLFTHFGASGPVILSASSYITREIRETQRKEKDGEAQKQPALLTLHIDLKPALTKEQLDARICRDFEEEKNKQFKNSLSRLLPAKLIPVMIRRSGILPEKQVNEITKEERSQLVRAIKEFSFTIVGTRSFNEAIITQGGISVKEVNPSTMESKKLPHLYFAGEILDTDAVTGGYNLQIAWSTGWVAGNAVP